MTLQFLKMCGCCVCLCVNVCVCVFVLNMQNVFWYCSSLCVDVFACLCTYVHKCMCVFDKLKTYYRLLDCSERAPENAVEIMSARNKRATAHAPRSRRTSTCPLPKLRTPNWPVSRCPQTMNTVYSSLWRKGAELKHDIIRLRSLVDVQSKSPYCLPAGSAMLI